jgi:hypothetical protein
MIRNSYSREQPAGFLERAGVGYYRRLAKKTKRGPITVSHIDDLPPDAFLQSRMQKVTVLAVMLAFLIGAFASAVSVWIGYRYSGSLDTTAYYALQVGATLLSAVAEFVALFWLSLDTVHALSRVTQHQPEEEDSSLPGDDAISNLLARAALEVPDPVIRYLGIDPLKYISKPKLLLIGVLYKAKVLLTTVAAKFILQRMGGKFVSRIGLAWVSIPIAALWNAVVMYRVAQEARLRLCGHRLAYYLVNDVMTADFVEQLSPEAKEGTIRAISTMMVLTQNYHPNMLILLYQFSQTFGVEDQDDFDNWLIFTDLLAKLPAHERFFLLDLLCVAAAFDGHLSDLELQQLPLAFGEHTQQYLKRIKQLQRHLVAGKIHAAKEGCRLDFQPG